MTDAACEGAEANNAMAAAAAKWNFMFHSPDCGPSFKTAIHPHAIYHCLTMCECTKRGLRGKKIALARV
jgi:hypothetical protein